MQAMYDFYNKMLQTKYFIYFLILISISFFCVQRVNAYFQFTTESTMSFTTATYQNLDLSTDKTLYGLCNRNATILLTIGNTNTYNVGYTITFSNNSLNYTIDGAQATTYIVSGNVSRTHEIVVDGTTQTSELTIIITPNTPYGSSHTKPVSFDLICPVCTWGELNANNLYLKNGTTSTYTIDCTDESGIINADLTSSSFIVSNNSLASISGVTRESVTNGNKTGYRYTVSLLGKTGNGNITLSLNENAIKDNNLNWNTLIANEPVIIDNESPSVPTSNIRLSNSSGTIIANETWSNQTIWWGDFTSSDINGSGVNRIELSNLCTGEVQEVANINGYTYSTDMNYSYCLRAVDNVGNLSAWSSPYYMRIDTTTPTTPTISYEANYVKSGLILHYDGRNNTGAGHQSVTSTWTDLSGNGKHGTIVGGVWTENGLSLDGVDDGVFLGSNLIDIFKSNNTLEISVMTSVLNSRDIYFGNYDVVNSINYEKRQAGMGPAQTRVYVNTGAYNGETPGIHHDGVVETYTWVWDKTNGQIIQYRNGNIIAIYSSPQISNYSYNWSNAYVGRDSRTGSTSLAGTIYNVRAYNKTLTQDEIIQNYNADKANTGTSSTQNISVNIGGSTAPSEILKYQYSTNSGATWNDYSSNNKPTISTIGTTPITARSVSNSGVYSSNANSSVIITNSVVLKYSSGNLLYGLDNVGTTTNGNMTYSINNGVVTATGNATDGFGMTPGRVYLEAGKTYTFNTTISGSSWGQEGIQQAFLLLNGGWDTYYHMYSNVNYTFTPTVSGTYWLRLDVDGTGVTNTFSNIRIEEIISQTKTVGSTFGTFPAMSKNKYSVNGWYTLESGGTQINANTTVPNVDTIYYAHWSLNTTPPVITQTSYGGLISTDPTFASGMNGTSVYNNTGNGLVTNERVAYTTPYGSYALKIRTTGTASPGWGGFYFANLTTPERTYTTKIVAKIPIGYNIAWGSNRYGNASPSASATWITSQAGTGEWAEYVMKVTTGATGDFSTTNFFYLDGITPPTAANPLEWYVAYAGVYASPNVETYLFNDPMFNSGTNSTGVYDWSGVNVTNERVAYTTPVGSYALKVQSIGAGGPGYGGFYIDLYTEPSTKYVYRLLAKIPVGYTLNYNRNYAGDNPTEGWLTSQAGTGDWAEYIYYLNTTGTGTFQICGHFYLTGSPTPTAASPLTWYVAYANGFEVTKQYINTNSGITLTATDVEDNIIAYGINQNSLVEPTWITVPSTGNFGTIINEIAANGNYYVWIKDSTNQKANALVNIDNVSKIGPGVPTSNIRLGSSTGAIITNGTWANQTIWWGDFSATDNGGSGINRIELSNGCTGVVQENAYTPGYTYTTDMNVYYCLRAVDNAGNMSAWSSPYYLRVDKTVPTISYSLTNGLYNSNQSVVVTPSDANYYRMAVHVYKDGSFISAKSTDSTTSASYTVNIDSVGNWYVYTQAFDAAGNKHTQLPDNGVGWYYQNYIIDQTLPTCSFSNLPSGLEEGASTTIYLTCTDANGISTTALTSSNFIKTPGYTIGSITSTTVTNGYQYNITITGTSHEVGTISLNAGSVSDNAGNGNVAINGSLTIQKTIYLTFNMNGASSYVFNGTTYTSNQTIAVCTLTTSGTCNVTAPTIYRANYTTCGWSLTATTPISVYRPGTTITLSSSGTTLYAITGLKSINFDSIVGAGSGLYNMYNAGFTNMASGKLMYRGANPNNYIAFNCTTEATKSGCTMWRILAIEANDQIELINYTSTTTSAWGSGYFYGSTVQTGAQSFYNSSIKAEPKSHIVLFAYDNKTLKIDSGSTTMNETIALEVNGGTNYYVAIPRVTDYIVSSTNVDPSTNWNGINGSSKKAAVDNWMYDSSKDYFLISKYNSTTPRVQENSNGSVSGEGDVSDSASKYVKQVLHLNSDVFLLGSGTSGDPYYICPACTSAATSAATCAVVVSNAGTYETSKNVSIAYYANGASASATPYSWSFAPNWTASNTINIAMAGTIRGYIMDSAGATNTCTANIVTRAEYQHQTCSQCKSCTYCPSGGVMLSGGSYCYKNPGSSGTEHDCSDDGGSWVNGVCYYDMYRATTGTSCGYCGCNSWNTSDTAWYTTSCGTSNYKSCKDKATRVVYAQG